MNNLFTNAVKVGSGIRPDEYHKQPLERGNPKFVMTRSNLKEILTCAKRWKAGYESDDTKATVWGSLIDCLVLTKEHFDDLFAVYPLTYPVEPTAKDPRSEKPWSGNATFCREWKEEHQAAGRTCIKEDVLDRDGEAKEDTQAVTMKRAREAVAALHTDPIIEDMLVNSDYQVMVTADYHDRATGLVIPCKTLVDIWPHADHPTFGKSQADLKTAVSAAPGAWEKAVLDRGYDMQAAMNLEMALALGEDRQDFKHVIQESFEPWQTGRRFLSLEFIAGGREFLVAALEYYAQCLKHDFWPDYDEGAPAKTMVLGGWQITEQPSSAPFRAMRLPYFPQVQGVITETKESDDITP